jgi:hypothetical protein
LFYPLAIMAWWRFLMDGLPGIGYLAAVGVFILVFLLWSRLVRA